MDETSLEDGDSMSYRVKEDLLTENLLNENRRRKAKVLRLQQLKNYQSQLTDSTLPMRQKPDELRKVKFSPTSLIQDAIKEGNKYEVLDLLSNGVSVNFNDTQSGGMTLLHQACVYDDYIIAQSLIKQGASVNTFDDYRCTPLHICCLWNSMKCAQLLLSSDAMTNALDVDSNFAIDLAPEDSHMKAMIKKHMQQKLKVDESQLNSLRNKTQKMMLHDIRNLLEQGLSVDNPGPTGITLLHIAVTNGYLSAARMLLENSANVNVADTHLWTPLHCAAKYKQAKMVKLLLSHYANPHARSISNLTPKDLTQDQEIVKMLSNAEDTFLDLDNQKTPSKPKRFSASLLDQNDGEEIFRVQSRLICASSMSKRDLTSELQLLKTSIPQLARDIQNEKQPTFNTSISGQPITQNQGFMFSAPPPLPPRDDGSPAAQTSRPLPVKPIFYQSTNLHDERLHKAVVTIQRAFRKYQRRPEIMLSRMLRNIDDCGNGFYDQVVLQNADDIAKESDRQRAIKVQQRNSWSADAPKATQGFMKQDRPLSTGHLMSYVQDSSAVWLPQAPAQHHQGPMSHNYHQQIPPDVVPYYSGPQRSWSTMPHRGIQGKPNRNSGSIDSGLSMDSNPKDFSDTTANVKRSLTMKERQRKHQSAPTIKESVPVRLRKSSLGALRPSSNYTTYKMPPLTPTVATLIHHTTAVTQDQTEVDQSMAKVMQPVTMDDDYLPEHGTGTFPRHRYHSMKTPSRDHRYGSMLSDRSRILRDNRLTIRNTDQTSPSPNRHSWDCSNRGNHDDPLPPPPVHPIVSPPAAYENKRFSDEMTTSFTNSGSFDHRSYVDVTLPRRKSGHAPPPPPPRDPRTRLSESSGNLPQQYSEGVGRKGSFGMLDTTAGLGRPPQPAYESQTLPFPRRNRQSVDSDNDELPIIPPPLPLYTPQVVINKRLSQVASDQAFPPPPEELLTDANGALEMEPNNEQGEDSFSFPPPPPSL